MIAAVRVRSDIDAREKVSRTLQDLGLEKNNQLGVFEDTDSIRGMLSQVKDYIAYGEIDDETVERLEEKTGKNVEEGGTVSLSPPSGGYRDTRKTSGQGGSLGDRKDMDDLVQRMV